jgi:hypothetical protein
MTQTRPQHECRRATCIRRQRASGRCPRDRPLPIVGTPELPALNRLRSDAMAKIAALKIDSAFQERLLRGGMAELAEVQRLQKIVNSPTQTIVGGVDPGQVQQRLDSWNKFADLTPEVTEQLRNGTPVTPAEYKMAQQTKARLMSDKAWCARYLDGGMRERQQMSLVSIILSSQIAPAK